MVRLSFAAFVLSVASVAVAANSGPSDASILQYALTLEHLEATFYREADAKFAESDYASAGYTEAKAIKQRVTELKNDEKAHVDFLTAGLKAAGAQPVRECTYDFTAALSSVDSFLATSRILESVGVSAYLGAAADITTDAYLTAAGSILTVEARHQAVISEINEGLGYPSAFDTPLNYNEVFSLAAPFIVKCQGDDLKQTPATQAYKPLQFKTQKPQSGKDITIRVPANPPKNLYLIVLNGLTVSSVKVNKSTGVARLPSGLTGFVPIVLSSSEAFSNDNVVAFSYINLPGMLEPIVVKRDSSKRRMMH